jgi:hypothetical protein
MKKFNERDRVIVVSGCEKQLIGKLGVITNIKTDETNIFHLIYATVLFDDGTSSSCWIENLERRKRS